MNKKQFYVYEIRSKTSGKAYYGSTSNFKRRRSQHLQMLRGSTHHSSHLQNAWKVYLEPDFVFTVLHTFETEQDMLACEKNLLCDLSKTYNVSTEVDKGHTRGRHHSFETKAKLSAIFKGRVVSETTKAKIRTARAKQIVRSGWKHTEEIKQLIKEKRALQTNIRKGHKFSIELRRKLSDAKVGKEYPRVKVVTPDGVFVGVKKAAEHFAVNPATIRYRVKVKTAGWSYESI